MSISQLDDYSPIGWQNYASGGTKLNATNLNHGDSAIDANRDKINEVVSAVNEATSYIEATETLTGNPVEITTAVAENLSGCEVGIVAQQDGTPSPSSPVAITGMSSVTVNRSGKNLANPQNASNPDRSSFTYTEESDDTITATKGVSGGKFLAKFTASVIEGQTYTFSFGDHTVDGTTTNTLLYLYSDDLWGTSVTNFTISASTKSATWTSTLTGKIAIGVYSGGSEASGSVISLTDFMVRLSSDTDSTYEAYNGTDYTFNIGSTCYGGTLNTKTGVLTVTHTLVDMGTMAWSRMADYRFYSSSIKNRVEPPTTTSVAFDGLSSIYNIVPYVDGWGGNGNVFMDPQGIVYCRNDGYTDASSFTTAMSGVQLVYKRVTPTTITLTPQEIALIVGENTLSTDGNSMTASYSVSLSDILRRLKALES